MTRYGLVLNLDACRDMRGCMVACKMKTRSFLGSHYIDVMTSTSNSLENPNTYFLPKTCQHCGRPSCVASCPHGVLVKRADGIVAVSDTALCEQCADKRCVQACPYQAIDLDPVDGRIGKCDLCADLVDAGGVPACVSGCMNHAIFFADFDNPDDPTTAAIEALGDKVHVLKPETGNGPGMRYILSFKKWRDAQELRSPAWRNA